MTGDTISILVYLLETPINIVATFFEICFIDLKKKCFEVIRFQVTLQKTCSDWIFSFIRVSFGAVFVSNLYIVHYLLDISY